MRSGIYKLTQDVTNPKPDRRKRDWRCKPIWEKGQVFYLTWANMDFSTPCLRLSQHTDRFNSWYDVPQARGDGTDMRGHWDLITPHLTPVELETLDQLLVLNEHGQDRPGPRALLRRLVEADLVSVETLTKISEDDPTPSDQEQAPDPQPTPEG